MKCQNIGCDSYLYSTPLRSMETILNDNIIIKYIDYCMKTYDGGRCQDELHRVIPCDPDKYKSHCEAIYENMKNKKSELFSTLGLKQLPHKPFWDLRFLH